MAHGMSIVKKYNENKGFCCINARTIDFAKFGQLYLVIEANE